MKTTKVRSTDSNKILQADEFVWAAPEPTYAHAYVAPKLELLLKSLKAEDVLDLGCGNGVLTNQLAGGVRSIIGIDASTTGIAVAQASFSHLDFRMAPLEKELSEELKGNFDVVIAAEVIEHLLLPRQLFQRAREALKPGGYLCVTTPYHGYIKNLALAVCGKFDHHWHPLRDYGHVKFFSKKTLGELFAEQGFDVVSYSRVGRFGPVACSMIMVGQMRS
jgi:2-polyprenyl-3-methyl-5-hydroxy-6-metoxy-1,4-benzoquinol methylase